MPESEDGFYRLSIQRIERSIVAIGAAGAVYAGLARGWRWGVGFAAGAAVSGLSFWRWSKVVEGLGERKTGGRPVRWVLRFGLLAGAAYVTIAYSGFSVVAALLGLLVAAMAVVFEIVFQLFSSGIK